VVLYDALIIATSVHLVYREKLTWTRQRLNVSQEGLCMEKALVLSFNDEKGVTCRSCMLSFSKGEKDHCAAMGSRPICPEDGKRNDCPLVAVLPEEI